MPAKIVARVVGVEELLGEVELAGAGLAEIDESLRVVQYQRDLPRDLVLAPVAGEVGRVESLQRER